MLRILISLLILPFLVASFLTTSGQEETPEVFTVVDVMPRFHGCENVANEEESKSCTVKGLGTYLGTIRYPDTAKDNNLQGKVYVKFLVEKDGSVSNVVIGKGSGHQILDDAAIAHVKKMLPWTPGLNKGEAVRVQYVVPFIFRIRNPEPIEEGGRKKKKKKKKKK